MLVTTHTLVATTIAVKTRNPYIYVPAALINHFTLDTFPHFGNGFMKSNRNFEITALCDAVLGVSIFLVVSLTGTFPILPLFIVDILAGWPDLVMIYQRFINPKFLPGFYKFHSAIQKLESPFGIIFEAIIWVVCLGIIFA